MHDTLTASDHVKGYLWSILKSIHHLWLTQEWTQRSCIYFSYKTLHQEVSARLVYCLQMYCLLCFFFCWGFFCWGFVAELHHYKGTTQGTWCLENNIYNIVSLYCCAWKSREVHLTKYVHSATSSQTDETWVSHIREVCGYGIIQCFPTIPNHPKIQWHRNIERNIEVF